MVRAAGNEQVDSTNKSQSKMAPCKGKNLVQPQNPSENWQGGLCSCFQPSDVETGGS